MIGLILAVVDVTNSSNLQYEMHFEDHLENPPDIVVENSQGIRIVIALTTVLAIAAVIVRMWLYTFWKDYKSTLQFFIKQMEIQRNLKR